MNAANTLMIDIVSSPGAGKTLFLEKIGTMLMKEGLSFHILTGDCYTSRDAERMDARGLPVAQINTEGACHIDAQLIEKALREVDLEGLDLVIIENVGNLVCPAAFDLGEDMKIAFLNTAEGHDKPEKYPLLIEESSLAIINKIDLIPYTDFDIAKCEEAVNRVNSHIDIVRISCKTGEGLDEFIKWIKGAIKIKKEKKS